MLLSRHRPYLEFDRWWWWPCVVRMNRSGCFNDSSVLFSRLMFVTVELFPILMSKCCAARTLRQQCCHVRMLARRCDHLGRPAVFIDHIQRNTLIGEIADDARATVPRRKVQWCASPAIGGRGLHPWLERSSKIWTVLWHSIWPVAH